MNTPRITHTSTLERLIAEAHERRRVAPAWKNKPCPAAVTVQRSAKDLLAAMKDEGQWQIEYRTEMPNGMLDDMRATRTFERMIYTICVRNNGDQKHPWHVVCKVESQAPMPRGGAEHLWDGSVGITDLDDAIRMAVGAAMRPDDARELASERATGTATQALDRVA